MVRTSDTETRVSFPPVPDDSTTSVSELRKCRPERPELPQSPAKVLASPSSTAASAPLIRISRSISATHPDFQKNGHSRVVASVDFTGTGSLQSNGMTLGEGMLLGD